MLEFVDHEEFRTDRKRPRIVMNYSGFDLGEVVQDHPELCEFNVVTYATFKSAGSDVAYRPINDFLRTCNLEEQQEIASAFVEMNAIVSTIAENQYDIAAIVDSCTETLNELDDNIDLCRKLDKFTISRVEDGTFPMEDMSKAGSRPHDRKEMTFYYEDAVIVIAMTMLSKLLSPIIGQFISRHTSLLGDFKETKISGIFTDIYLKRYPEISDKLKLYIENLVEAKAKNDVNVHLAGVTSDTTAMKVEASLKTKKFPMVDHYKSDGSIIKYIAACIRSHIENQMTPSQNTVNAKMHTDPKDESAVASNEETNFSRMEKQSRSSKYPLSKEPLASVSAEDVIKWLILDGLIDRDEYEENLNWYTKNPMIITSVSLFLLITYFGKDMGGGKTLYVLDKTYILKLAVALQLILIDKGYYYLAHGCTMEESAQIRDTDAYDAEFIQVWRSTGAYTDCKKVMAGGFGDIQWDVGIKYVVQAFLTKNYYTHVSPRVHNKLKISKPEIATDNHTRISNYLEFVEEFMLFVREMWLSASLREE